MAKLIKYRIIADDFTDSDNSKVLAEHIGKGKTQDWLHELKRFYNDKQKRQLLLAFYDIHINDHNWSKSVLDFLLNSAIDTRFKKVVNKPIKIGAMIYTIEEEPHK